MKSEVPLGSRRNPGDRDFYLIETEHLDWRTHGTD